MADKFSTVDLKNFCNLTAAGMASPPWHPELAKRLGDLPAGAQEFWGVPFALPPQGGLRWLELSNPSTVPVHGHATYVMIAHFCNPSRDAQGRHAPPEVTMGYMPSLGEHLADYILIYRDASEHRQQIRRRFEIAEPIMTFGQAPFAALAHAKNGPLDFRGPHERNAWGLSQRSIRLGASEGPVPLKCWLYALPNPHAGKELTAIRLEPTGADRLCIAGLTLYHGRSHPLRHRPLDAFRVVLSAEDAALPDHVQVDVDLGILARKYAVPAFEPERWLAAELQGWGEEQPKPEPMRDLRLEMSASPDATVTINRHPIDLASVYQAGTGTSRDGAVRIELLPAEKTWVHVTVADASTGKPTPVRIHFRTPDGRYLPPYGHRREVNDNWFEDYGADLKLGSTEYAYVDGRFQIELPVGHVYVEVSKGFEYQPLRQRLEIKPGQRDLSLTIERPFDLRAKGWVTADTHVHFISPQTAWLEAQAEGVNLVNLLASQWGDLFTNVGDLSRGPSGVSTDDTLIWVSTENRQHMLGHINLLGVKGDPVFPMATDGPGEGYLGDPTESSLAEWADRCREREGLVVIPHFPTPFLEVAADIVLGKVDGVEIRYFSHDLDNLQTREWYRFLNLGYRVAAVGGTDKMWAGMPVGGVRTYAKLDDEFTFANWARAVRRGNTFTSSGPLIGLSVEGHAPGDDIRLPAGGGTLEVEAWADSLPPIHELQLVVNGQVVERVSQEKGTGRLLLRSKIRLMGSAWVAARCVSRLVVWHGWPINVAAHTSPVYIVVAEQEIFNPSDATYMLTLLDGGLTYLDTLSIPASREKHEQIKGVFRQAKAALHRRLHAQLKGAG